MLRVSGVRLERKKAEVITTEINEQLWYECIIGSHSPQALPNAIVYLNGKNFHLRGVQEHANMRFSQLKRAENPSQYAYYEYGSKNHSSGANDPSSGKIIPIVAIGGSRCHVALLDLYFLEVFKS